jgi:hypothetical protein
MTIMRLAGVMICLGAAAAAQPARPPVLAADWPAERLEGVLLARDAWRPIPPITDRDGWARV